MREAEETGMTNLKAPVDGADEGEDDGAVRDLKLLDLL